MKRKRRWDESARGQLHMTAIPFLLRILFSPHFPSPISEWLLTDVACCLLPRPFIRGCFHENAREIDHGCQIAAWTRWRAVRLREVGACGKGREEKMGLRRASE